MPVWRRLDVHLVGCIAGIVGSLLVYSILQVAPSFMISGRSDPPQLLPSVSADEGLGNLSKGLKALSMHKLTPNLEEALRVGYLTGRLS